MFKMGQPHLLSLWRGHLGRVTTEVSWKELISEREITCKDERSQRLGARPMSSQHPAHVATPARVPLRTVSPPLNHLWLNSAS